MARMKKEKILKLPKDKTFFRKHILYVILLFLLTGLCSFQTCCTAAGSNTPTERVAVISPLENVYKSVWDMMSEKNKDSSSCAVTVIKRTAGESLLALSAYHCVADRVNPVIALRWCEMPGKKSCEKREVVVFSKDPAKDLVLLIGIGREKTGGNFAPVAADIPKLGEVVYLVGAPANHTRSISRGVLSYMDRNKEGVMIYYTDTAMWFGNSGGGMFNEKGQLIGVAHAIAMLRIQLGPFTLSGGAIDNFGMCIGLPEIHQMLQKK